MNKTFHLIILSLFVAQSLVLYIVEGMLPVPFIAPGAKLGLANLITVIALYALPRKRDVVLVEMVDRHRSRAVPGTVRKMGDYFFCRISLKPLQEMRGGCSGKHPVPEHHAPDFNGGKQRFVFQLLHTFSFFHAIACEAMTLAMPTRSAPFLHGYFLPLFGEMRRALALRIVNTVYWLLKLYCSTQRRAQIVRILPL